MVVKKQQEKQSVARRIEALLDPLCTAENFEFVSVELLSDSGDTIVRILMIVLT